MTTEEQELAALKAKVIWQQDQMKTFEAQIELRDKENERLNKLAKWNLEQASMLAEDYAKTKSENELLKGECRMLHGNNERLKMENESLGFLAKQQYTLNDELQADKAELLEALGDTIYHELPGWLNHKISSLLSKHEAKPIKPC